MKHPAVIVVLAVFCICGVSYADDDAAGQGSEWLAAMVLQAEKDASPAAASAATSRPAEEPGWKKPIPLGFYLDYMLLTDYMWRGLNLSEYRGEGREKLNHQLTVGANYDTGDFGTIDFSVWFQWYGANDKISGVSSDGSLQEVDYTVTWTYDLSKLCPQVPVELTLGWAGYDLIQLSDDAGFTNVFLVTLALDDQKLFGEDWFALNPTVMYEQDLDDAGAFGQGSWLEFGVSHEFDLAKCPGVREIPIVRDLTATPSIAVMVDVGYIDSGTRISSMRYGLNFGYDLSKALGIPEQYGSIGVSAFINYSDAIADDSSAINLNDELWGGMNIGWSW